MCISIDLPQLIVYSATLRRFFPDMNPLGANMSRIGREERLRLLALSTAILGLVLAPLGLSG